MDNEIKNGASAEQNLEEAAALTEKPDATAHGTLEKKKAEKPQKPKKGGGLRSFLKSRKARHGSLAIAITVIVTAIIVALNFIVGLLTERFPDLKLDFTANKAYALQADTIDYMNHLNKDVNVYVLSTENQFEAQGKYFVQAKNLLDKMVSSSNGKLSLKFVDTTTEPAFTQKYPNIDWTSNQNVAIVECSEQYKGLSLDECFEYDSEYASYGYYEFTATKIEQAVVTAVLNVTTDDKVVVDILTGSQEADYSALSTLLTNNAYQVNELSLVTSELDDDAKFLVLYAPAVDLDESAAQKISEWLENGRQYGRQLIYIANSNAPSTPNIDALLDDWGMKLTEGYVFETNSDYLLNGATQFAFITDYTDYYRENLKNPSIPVVAYQTRGIETSGDGAYALLNTSDKAGIMPYQPDESWDVGDAIKGEAIAVAAEGKKGSSGAESRVIVFGSEAMFTKNFMSLNSFNNSAFLMNIFNTLAEKDDETVTIESKSMESTELGVTDASTASVMFVLFVIVIPAAVLITGIVVWVRRRNR